MSETAMDFELGADPEDAPAAPKTRKKQAAVGMPTMVKIQLEESDNIPPTGLFIGLNGKGFLLRAGEPVDVPQGVLNVLEDAIMSTPVMDPSTQQVTGYRNRMRYPFRIVGTG